MFEDAVKFCDQALSIDKNHTKSLFRKAASLAYLFEFDESRKIF